MPKVAELFSRFRVAALAVLVSASLHAAVFVGLPARIAAYDDGIAAATYSANLDLAGNLAVSAEPAPARPRRPRSSLPKSRIAPPPPAETLAAVTPSESGVAQALSDVAPELESAPEIIALAQPAAPVKALEPEKFPAEALPASLTIDYHLTSVFADGRATYRWNRDGDTYRISAEAEAEGFFALFLEGRIIQESRGTVTAAGLRPEKFSERKPGGPPEGLEFDWTGKQVTFDRNGEKKTMPLADNTVDWLSMIFQLAHLPPKSGSLDLQVFTQRRMYRFSLKVLGVEEIEIPLGRVRALRLHHTDPENSKEVVDVWLGIDQHYVPVKLRFPAARNRLVVEQVATSVRSH